MKESIRIAFRIYKVLLPLSMLVFCIYMFIDDYQFIEKYRTTNWKESLGIWVLFLLTYSIGFSIYYWIFSLVIIVIYHQLIKRFLRK